MFKFHFVNLVNVNRDINLQRLASGKKKIKLEMHTVLLYHKLFDTCDYNPGVRVGCRRKRI